jgi:transposase-like protein
MNDGDMDRTTTPPISQMTFISFLSHIPQEKQMRKQLVRTVFGARPWCPHCGRQRYVIAVGKNKNFRCTKCRKPFSLTRATWISGMKISLGRLWRLVWCWHKKVPLQRAKCLLKLTIATIRHWYALFRDRLEADVEAKPAGKIIRGEKFIKGVSVIGTTMTLFKNSPHLP